MRLYLMRHGEAIPVGENIREDAQRPLSPSGKTQVRQVAAGLRLREPPLGVVWCSPLLRTRETAALMAEGLGTPKPQTTPALAPNAAPAGVRSLVYDHPSPLGLLLVGHHPDVTLWTAFLSNLDPTVCPLFGTASIAAFDIDPAKGKTEFLWFQTAEQLSQS